MLRKQKRALVLLGVSGRSCGRYCQQFEPAYDAFAAELTKCEGAAASCPLSDAGLLTQGVPGVPQDPLSPPSGPRAPFLDSLKRTETPPGTP